jgi:hypothetical protein
MGAGLRAPPSKGRPPGRLLVVGRSPRRPEPGGGPLPRTGRSFSRATFSGGGGPSLTTPGGKLSGTSLSFQPPSPKVGDATLRASYLPSPTRGGARDGESRPSGAAGRGGLPSRPKAAAPTRIRWSSGVPPPFASAAATASSLRSARNRSLCRPWLRSPGERASAGLVVAPSTPPGVTALAPLTADSRARARCSAACRRSTSCRASCTSFDDGCEGDP